MQRKVFKYSINAEKYNVPIAMAALDLLEVKGYNKDICKMFNDAGIDMEVL